MKTLERKDLENEDLENAKEVRGAKIMSTCGLLTCTAIKYKTVTRLLLLFKF